MFVVEVDTGDEILYVDSLGGLTESIEDAERFDLVPAVDTAERRGVLHGYARAVPVDD